MRACLVTWVTLLSLSAGCRCSRLSGEIDGLEFTRCAQLDPPPARSFKAGQVEFVVSERTLAIDSGKPLKLAVFSGPISGLFSRAEMAALSESAPSLILWLGGLGMRLSEARANLASVTALRVPTVFVAGGADRAPLVREAFDSLDEGSEHVINGTGLRQIRAGKDAFAVLPGSALGRYAVDGEGCGFDEDDVGDVRAALSGAADAKDRVWLLAWNAPAGWGVTTGLGGRDVGSSEVAELGEALAAHGGVFAYPETQAAIAVKSKSRGGHAVVVPRLGRTGSTRAGGGRLRSSFTTLTLGAEGLVPGP